MNTPTAVDELIRYAKDRNFECDSHQDHRTIFLSSSDRFINTKYVIIKVGDILIVAFDSFGTRAFMNTTYTGAFFPVENMGDINFEMHPRDAWDFLFRRHRIRSEAQYLRKQVCITSDQKFIPENYLDESLICKYMEAAKAIVPLKLIIEDKYLQYISPLKDKKVAGIETHQWLFKAEEVDTLLNVTKAFHNKLNHIHVA